MRVNGEDSLKIKARMWSAAYLPTGDGLGLLGLNRPHELVMTSDCKRQSASRKHGHYVDHVTGCVTV